MTGALARCRATALLTLAATATMLVAAACGTATTPAGPAPRTPWPAISLNTTVTTPAGTWAVAVMGGSADQHNNFWQLAIRPAGTTRWKVITPPGTADNGGLILAPASHQMITGFRPSQDLTFTPLSTTTSSGATWTSAGPLTGAAADTPGALASNPAGALLAVLSDGTVSTSTPGYGQWHPVTSLHAIAATPAGRHCGLTALTAAAYTAAGNPLLAGICTRPGAAGIFAHVSGSWQLVSPALPRTLARDDVATLAISTTGNDTVALLAAGNPTAGQLLTAWTTDQGQHWTLSLPLALRGAHVTSASFWPGHAAVELTGRHGDTITPGHPWQALPKLPPGTLTLAPGTASGVTSALSARRTTLTIWQTGPSDATWTTTQAITVPIEYGSSG